MTKQVFKIFMGFTNMSLDNFLSVDRSNVNRNNGLKVIGK